MTQSADGNAFTEAATNALNGGTDSATVSASGGTITSTALAALTGSTQQLSYAELRSPVRQNDQVTVLDQHYADIGSDSDGDGKHDAGDIGIYRTVVGMEDVTLANGTTQHAVRVDMIAMIRVTYSSNGTNSPAVQAALQSTWYAPGIGIVKQRLTTPLTATTNEVAEEVLSYFDGITKGLGAKPAEVAKIAADATLGAGQPLQDPGDIVVFPDHALVTGTYLDVAGFTNHTIINSIDKSGKVIHSSLYPISVPRHGYFALGNQLIAVTQPGAAGQQCQLQMMHFDTNGGQSAGTPDALITIAPLAGQTLCSDVVQVAAAGDGNRIWLAMGRHSLSASGWVTDLFVRPFDSNGVPLANEISLMSVSGLLNLDTSTVPSGVGIMSISAAGGRALVRYATDTSGSIKVASITDAGVMIQTTLNATVGGNAMSLLATPTGAALLWQGPWDSVTHLAPARGVWLDASLTPLLSAGSTTLDSQDLAACPHCITFLNGAGDTLLASSIDMPSGKPETLTLASYKVGGGALATQAVTPLVIDFSDVSPYGQPLILVRTIPFADRVVVLAQVNSQLYTKVVWFP